MAHEEIITRHNVDHFLFRRNNISNLIDASLATVFCLHLLLSVLTPVRVTLIRSFSQSQLDEFIYTPGLHHGRLLYCVAPGAAIDAVLACLPLSLLHVLVHARQV
jgi:hypothetical protein